MTVSDINVVGLVSVAITFIVFYIRQKNKLVANHVLLESNLENTEFTSQEIIESMFKDADVRKFALKLMLGILLFLYIENKENHKNNDVENTSVLTKESSTFTPIVLPQAKNKIFFEEVTSYKVKPYDKEGFENQRTYFYGVYLKLPKDTTGVASEIMNYYSKKHFNDDAVHMYFFTNKNLIPSRFDGEWYTDEVREKIFAHFFRFTNGKILLVVDETGEFKR